MNWGIKVLQTSALPLGYGAILNYNAEETEIILLLKTDAKTVMFKRPEKWSG